MPRPVLWKTTIVALAFCLETSALTPTASGAQPDPLFDGDEPVRITITAPLRKILRDRKGDPEYQEALLELTDQGQRLDIRIRTRGKFRRQRKTCTFPPLRLNFRKKQTAGTVFAGQDKLKLVTHCRDGERFQQYLLKEYLAYRILNRLTEASFRVRLLQILYLDSDRPKDGAEQHYGFVVEHKSALAERLGAELADVEKIEYSELAADHAALMFLFQYLIGNTDWSFVQAPEGENCCHNAVLIQRAEGQYIPIPYDFDFSGFVDPPYAEPPKQFRLRNVRERLYRGLCGSRERLGTTIGSFQEVREDILRMIRDQQDLTDSVRQDLLDYVAEFYELLDEPAEAEARLFERCG